MTLHAEPGAMRGYAAQLSRAADDAASGLAFLDRHSRFDADGPLLGKIADRHRTVVDVLTRTFERMTHLLGASSSAMVSAAAYYQVTDAKAAEQLDAMLPAVGRATRPARPGVVE